MRVFSRVAGSFVLLFALGYLALLAFVPHAPSVKADDQLITGRSVADQLSQQARALIKGRKPGLAPN